MPRKLKQLNFVLSGLQRMKNKMDESKWDTMAAEMESIASAVMGLLKT
jgi:hypothetical protein